MPKNPNYPCEIIFYKIYNTKDDDIYIGSTSRKYLSQRWANHTYSWRQWKKGNLKKGTKLLWKKFSELGIQNFFIKPLEKKLMSNQITHHRYEGTLIKKYKPVLNQQVAGRTDEEYRDASPLT